LGRAKLSVRYEEKEKRKKETPNPGIWGKGLKNCGTKFSGNGKKKKERWVQSFYLKTSKKGGTGFHRAGEGKKIKHKGDEGNRQLLLASSVSERRCKEGAIFVREDNFPRKAHQNGGYRTNSVLRKKKRQEAEDGE